MRHFHPENCHWIFAFSVNLRDGCEGVKPSAGVGWGYPYSVPVYSLFSLLSVANI